MYNSVYLIGRLTKDPEIKETDNNKKVCNVTLAVQRSYKNAEGIYETDFIRCVLWNGIAGATSEFCKVGDVVGIKGRLQSSKYNDENNEELDNIAYENVSNWLKNNAKLTGNYFESEIYDYDGLSVSLWLDVFNKSSIQSFNYFTNGDISSHNLLIPAYEDKEGCF